MKISFLVIKKFRLKFWNKKQKDYFQYSMEDYFKACINTDSILYDFRYQIDILACHLLSPTRGDLYKKTLEILDQKVPFINFLYNQISRLIFVITIIIFQIYKACKNLLLKKNSSLTNKISNQKTLIISHADKPYQLYSDNDIYYGKRSCHNADFCILNKTDQIFEYSMLPKKCFQKNHIFPIETRNVNLFLLIKIYIKMIFTSLKILFYWLKSPLSRERISLFVESFSNETFLNFFISSQLKKILDNNLYESVITTWEGYPWEKIIAHYCNEKKIKIFGYIHAGPFSSQYSAYRKMPDKFFPYKFLTPTEISQSLLKKYFNYESVVVGSHKFYSSFFNFGSLLPRNFKNYSRKKILLLPQGTLKEVKDICELAFFMNFDQLEIIVRLHPALINNKKINKLIKNLKNASSIKDLIRISDDNLINDIVKSDYFLYRGSTSAIEAASFGLTPIYSFSKDELNSNLNSLDGIYLPSDLKVRNSKDLENILKKGIEYDISRVIKEIYSKPISFQPLI